MNLWFLFGLVGLIAVVIGVIAIFQLIRGEGSAGLFEVNSYFTGEETYPALAGQYIWNHTIKYEGNRTLTDVYIFVNEVQVRHLSSVSPNSTMSFLTHETPQSSVEVVIEWSGGKESHFFDFTIPPE